MIYQTQYLCLLMVFGAFVAAGPAASAGIFRGHPYQDRSSSTWSKHAAAPLTVVVAPSVENDTLSPEALLLDSAAHSDPSFGPLSGAPAQIRAWTPVTNALLTVWVHEDATVWVNGKRTTPQYLAGRHQGSRIISLTGLSPTEMSVASVEASLSYAGEQAPNVTQKLIPVVAGRCIEVRFCDDELIIVEDKRRKASSPSVVTEKAGSRPLELLQTPTPMLPAPAKQ